MSNYKRYTERKIDLSKFSEEAKSKLSDYYLKYVELNNILFEIENKIENGTYIEVPCNEGDKIYFDGGLWADHCKGEIMERYADIVRTDICTTHRGEIDMTFDFNDFGKKVFLTKEAAEAKLKELQERKR